eukprot:CAMPEP_0168405122 /NCGR_PEP_ID=MMETSP0228-20121227/24981_1 /TAXON_ID=133427 /ORGANISM="Protoceratium reticulatum, Strain CCCM 535 (=CCMP 1889)" /LENGTH=134 /DNA_ID=CAMNT_0008418745 /DNA_START=1 /DNA_END=405 /DNA_ORIENTATION=+
MVLAVIEIVLSVLLYGPELLVGVLRLCNGIRAQITGRQSWVPQATVEMEVESKLTLCYVFRKTWFVFAFGGAYLAYAVAVQFYDPFLLLTLSTWILYPFATYIACLPVRDRYKRHWLWTWVMDLKRSGLAANSS